MTLKIIPIVSTIFLLATAASAQDFSAPQKIVRFDDINLATPSGQAHLKARIESAIREVCPTADFWSLGALAQHRACVNTARTDVSAQLAAAQSEARTTQLALASNAP